MLANRLLTRLSSICHIRTDFTERRNVTINIKDSKDKT